MESALPYMWMIWGLVTAALIVLVVYGNTLSMREEDQLYLNSAEQVMMASEQKALISRMHGLAHIVVGVGIFSAVLFATCIGMWAWVGLSK